MAVQPVILNFPQGLLLTAFHATVEVEIAAGRLTSLAPVTQPGAPGPIVMYTLVQSGPNQVTLVGRRSVSDADVASLRQLAAAHSPTPPAPAPDTTPPLLPQALRDKLQPGGGAFTAAEQMTYNRLTELRWRYIRRMLMGSAE